MKTCSKCGASGSDEMKFCPICGNPLNDAAAPAASAVPPRAPSAPGVPPMAPPVAPSAETPKTDFSASVAKLNDTADTTSEFDPQDISNNKVMAVLSYLGLLVLVPILAAKESKFARFHANQGLVLLLVDIIYGIAQSVVVSIFSIISGQLGNVFSKLLGLAWIAIAILVVLGVVNAANGKAKELPLIGKIRLLK